MKQHNSFSNEFQNSRRINEISVDFQDIEYTGDYNSSRNPGFQGFPGAVDIFLSRQIADFYCTGTGVFYSH